MFGVSALATVSVEEISLIDTPKCFSFIFIDRGLNDLRKRKQLSLMLWH